MSLFRNILMNINKSLLPTEYKQLQWIENPSDAYINTGFTTTNTTTAEIIFELPYVNNGTLTPIGSRSKNNNSRFIINRSSNGFQYNYGSKSSGFVNLEESVYNIKMRIGEGTINGSSFPNLSNVNLSDTLPIYLFAMNNNKSARNNAKNMKLYSCKIYNNNLLVRDFIPAKRKSDSAIGLYDIVNNTFNLSPNNTKFIGG